VTTATLIEKVRAEIGPLDDRGEQIVAAALKVFRDNNGDPALSTAQKSFKSRNITLAEYTALERAEQRHYHDEAEDGNQQWVQEHFKKLNAKWLLVVDDRVIRHGATMQNFPDSQELLLICAETGKYPFAFFNPTAFMIEESATLWHDTRDPSDAYPAVAITLVGNNKRLAAEADLDTGSADSFTSLDWLMANDLIKIQTSDIPRSAKHLSKPFFYFALVLTLEISDLNGQRRNRRMGIFCVEDWQASSFTLINPARTFLLGRQALFELQPRLTLDFAARCTEVQMAGTVN